MAREKPPVFSGKPSVDLLFWCAAGWRELGPMNDSELKNHVPEPRPFANDWPNRICGCPHLMVTPFRDMLLA